MTDQTLVAEKANQIAWALGLSSRELKVIVPAWLEVMREGVIVKVHVRRWRAIMRLTPEHLGIVFEDDQEKDAFSKAIRLGDVYLLPDRMVKALASIDSGMRKVSEKWGYKTHWGDMLTPGSFFEWQREFSEYESRYLAIRDDLYYNWDSIILEVADMHRANARAAYRRELQRAQATGQVSQVVSRYTESEFVSSYTQAILAAIPSRLDVTDSFIVEKDLYYIPLPSLMAKDQAEAEQSYQQAREAREKADLSIAMQREVVRNYKSTLDRLVVDHMAGLVSQLNGVLYEAAEDVLSTTQANNRLHPRSIVQLKAALSRIKALNVLDYPDIEKMVNQAESILGLEKVEGKTLEQVTGKLSDLATVTKATILAMGDRPQRAGRDIAESEIPSLGEIRQARQRLGLSPAEQPAQTRQTRASI